MLWYQMVIKFGLYGILTAIVNYVGFDTLRESNVPIDDFPLSAGIIMSDDRRIPEGCGCQ